jgi:hypothetical protein
MKSLRAITTAGIFFLSCATAVFSQTGKIKISVNEIVADDHISGTVSGINPTDTDKYCAVVYVHTDIWYIHPYAAGGEGQSWAAVQPNGDWSIPTVKRDFPADKMDALLLRRDNKKDCAAPSKTADIASIPGVKASAPKNLKNTADAGKL